MIPKIDAHLSLALASRIKIFFFLSHQHRISATSNGWLDAHLQSGHFWNMRVGLVVMRSHSHLKQQRSNRQPGVRHVPDGSISA